MCISAGPRPPVLAGLTDAVWHPYLYCSRKIGEVGLVKQKKKSKLIIETEAMVISSRMKETCKPVKHT